jgi:ATP-binding cassette subfamily B protein
VVFDSGYAFYIYLQFVWSRACQIVRYALDLVKETISLYFLYDGFGAQTVVYEIFAFSILLYGSLILIMALLKGIFLFFVRQTLIVMSRHIEYDLKNEIYHHYQTLPLSFYRKNNTGDLMARISEDVGKVRMYVEPSLMYGLNLISVFILVVGYMLSVNAKLTWYVLLPVPFLSGSIYFVNTIIIRKSEEIQANLSKISTFVQEAFSGIRVLKAFVQEEPSTVAFTKQSNIYREKSLDLVKVDSLFTPLVSILAGLSSVLVVYIGGQEVMAGRLTPGSITEFIMYVYMLTWPMIALGWTTSQIQRAAASQQRINEFLNIKTDIVSTKDISQPIEGAIDMNHVRFVYPDSGIEALHDFSMHVKAGESVAILGTTGSGKSTVANLLCRMYDTTEGQIKVDGFELKEWNVQSLRGQIGYVPQDVFLFSDSIKNNVRFGSLDMSDEQVIQATKDADLYNNIMDFPNNLILCWAKEVLHYRVVKNSVCL